MRERPAAQYGSVFWGEASILPEVSSESAFRYSCYNNWATPFFIASCDYVLMSGEVYAASAYLSKEVAAGTIVAEDCAKHCDSVRF